MEHLAKLPYAIWENQFNLFDSHDVSRLHNDPAVNSDEYRGAVMFQFLLTNRFSMIFSLPMTISRSPSHDPKA